MVAKRDGESARAFYERAVETKPAGAAKFRSLKRDLDVFGARDLYEFAAPPGIANPRNVSGETLVGSAEERINDFGRATSERSAAERLRSRAREIFGDAQERARYDDYLQWVDVKLAFDELADVVKGPSAYAADGVSSIRGRLAAIVGSSQLAQDLIDGYDEKSGGTVAAVMNGAASAVAAPRATQPQQQPFRKPTATSSQQPARNAGGYTAPLQQDLSGLDIVECPHCGNATRANDAFCVECGGSLSAAARVADAPRRDWPAASRAVSHPDAQHVYAQPYQQEVQAGSSSRWPVAVIAVSLAAIFVGALLIGFLVSGKLGKSPSELPENVVFAATTIVPVDARGDAIDSYKVAIHETVDANSDKITDRRFTKSGFSIEGFQDDGLHIDPGLHCLEIKTDKGTYKVTIDYRSGSADMKQNYQIKCM